MANPEHEKILKQGVEAWNKWRSQNPLVQPDLSNINLWERDLSGLIEESAEGPLSKALFPDSKSRWFCEITARSCLNLRGVILRDATFCFANLSGVDLVEADLSGANFYGASLVDACLWKANLRGAIFYETIFANTDLSETIGLDMCVHLGPSKIDVRSLVNSPAVPVSFLRGCGLPEEFIQFLPALLADSQKFFSCFISHSTKDHIFVKKLKDDLEDRGVRCYYFPEHARSGEQLWNEIGSAIKRHDKLLLICSRESLQSAAVLREIERALQREDHDKKNILFPIRIDEYLFDAWEHERKPDITGKVVGDFREWQNPKSYEQSIERLVRDLKAN